MLLPTTGYRDKNWAICLNTQLQKCRKEQTVITIKEGGGIPNFAIWERASVHTHLTDIRRPLRVADKYRCCSSNPHRLAILILATHIWIEVVGFALDAQRLLSCLFFAEREKSHRFPFPASSHISSSHKGKTFWVFTKSRITHTSGHSVLFMRLKKKWI